MFGLFICSGIHSYGGYSQPLGCFHHPACYFSPICDQYLTDGVELVHLDDKICVCKLHSLSRSPFYVVLLPVCVLFAFARREGKANVCRLLGYFHADSALEKGKEKHTTQHEPMARALEVNQTKRKRKGESFGM